MKKIIITVLGQDRPGIIAAVSKNLAEQNCNIEDISQMILQSEFSGFFIASLPSDLTLERLRKVLVEKLEDMKLHIHLNAYEDVENPSLNKGEPFIVSTLGPDKRGLVAAFTEVISSHNVNITNLRAVFKGGSDPDKNIMVYDISVSPDVDQEELFADLRQKARTLGLDISIQHKNIFKAINKI